ncbi:MAG: DUF4340 domain-containing protein [Deltaproteobacteria bacterium]|nr:DUF4340 domain-containing protein [Deltaproteobacteria bacterium]
MSRAAPHAASVAPAQALRGAGHGLRRLVLLGMLDVLLLVALLLWPAARAPGSGLIFPRSAADPGAVVELRRPGEAALVLTGLAQRPTITLVGAGQQATPAPLAADAERALRAALSALEPRRRLRAARPEYGLTPPAAELVVRSSARAPAVSLALGNLTPLGDGRYARDRLGVLVVDRELSDAFLIPLARLRDARIFALDPAQPLAVTVSAPSQQLVLERAPDGRTWVTAPPLGRQRAAPDAATRLLAVLSLLETAPDATPPVDVTGAATLLSIQTGPRTLELLDLPCTTIDGLHAHSTINLINTMPPARSTACLLGETARALRDLAAADYSDPVLLPVAATEVTRVELSAGPDTLALQRKGGGFSWLIPAPPFSPDTPALEAWLTALGSVQGASVVAVPSSTPRAQLALTLRSGAVLTLRLHTRAPSLGARARVGARERLLVQRDDEAFALDVEGDEAWFAPEPLRFRERQLLAVNPTDVRGVIRRLRGRSETLSRAPGDGGLRLDGGPAGQGAAALVDALAGLRATGWLRWPRAGAGAAPTRPHTTLAELEVTVEELSRHQQLTLALGPSSADGSCVGWWTGQRADDAGFTLAPEVCAVLLGKLSGE